MGRLNLPLPSPQGLVFFAWHFFIKDTEHNKTSVAIEEKTIQGGKAIPEAVARREVQCKSYVAKMAADYVRTGFKNTVFLYCSKDQTVLEFSSFDTILEKLVCRVHPRVLAWDGRVDDLKKVEDSLEMTDHTSSIAGR